MTRPTDAGSFAEDAYEQLVALQYAEVENDYALLKFLGAMGSMYQLVVDVSEDIPEQDIIGWMQVLRPDLCPAVGLPWLAQLVGVQLPDGLSEADQRQMIIDAPNQHRGTPAAMISAVKPYLTGQKNVLFHERVSDAYTLLVTTFANETPNPAQAEQALRLQKPAGIVMTYQVLVGQDWVQLRDNYATFQAAKDAYSTFERMATNTTP